MRITVLVKGTGAKHRDPLFQLDIFLVIPQLKNKHPPFGRICLLTRTVTSSE